MVEQPIIDFILRPHTAIGCFFSESEKLAIIFNSGRQYVYEGVTFIDYTKFESSESQGKLLHSVIKKYAYSQSKEIVDVKPMIEQINSIKETL